ncbi:MAG: tRNA pseudouridine(38-40) synthase TruA [Lewinella sp.]|nr:tRNA pseudouridine(38-40) synthase TruA [Lewinella sp.]
MRYFMELAYNGTRFHGWQRQPADASVQETLEEAFSLILRHPIELTGCGRTDTGVHASQYFAHFEFPGDFPPGFLRRINKFLGPDIAIYAIFPVEGDAHARFSANYRAYRYDLTSRKDPFRRETAFYYPWAAQLDHDQMQAAARLLLDYEDFTPFCKTGSDAKTMRCTLHRSEWLFGEHDLSYHIAANRFLRGMVRLIVGMCLSVGEGKLSLAEVRKAMDEQTLLPKSVSINPEGLFLCEVRYPFATEGALAGKLEE